MLELKNISKKYIKGNDVFTALDDVSFTLKKEDFMAVIGHSGSGKSTLLHTVGGLIHPDTGRVFFDQKDIYSLPQHELDTFRRTKVGFIFQQFHLIPYLTVRENIKLACLTEQDTSKIGQYLNECFLVAHENKYPSELSVGEKQRVAFIRAIIGNPDLLLADEPTGNLDPENSSILLELMKGFNLRGGTVMLVSHEQNAASYARSKITLDHGKIISFEQ